MLSACVTGQEIIAAEGREPIEAARKHNDSPDFKVLKEFSLPA